MNVQEAFVIHFDVTSRGARLIALASAIVLLAAAGVVAATASTAAVAATSPAPTISPAAGTPDASPQTQISILGVAPRTIKSVQAVGSKTGAHAGRLRSYSDLSGASFVPAQPFAAGERVSVTIRVTGRSPVALSFTVATPASAPPVLDAHVMQPAKLHHYFSQPGLLPPKIAVQRGGGGGGLAAGDIFLTPLPSPEVHPESNNELTISPVGPGGPMIVNRRGGVVWFDQLAPPLVAANFRPQTFAGREVLTWWQGEVTASAYGLGDGVIASTSYRVLRTVKAGNGYSADLHEFVLTPSGDALFTVYSPVMVHLPGTKPGTLSPLLDSIVQEVDVRTGLVVWEWHALGHIPLSDSYATAATSADFDAFHLNSIELLPHDQLLVSARDTSAVYDIDQRTGRILWTLGGKSSSFRLGRGARFWFQHDAQMLPGNEVSLFDDEAGPPEKASASRGLVLALHASTRTATVVHQYRISASDDLADSEGSLQTLPGGDKLVGFGSSRYVAEFTATGQLRYEASLPVDDGTYRAFVYPWSATPSTRPAMVAKRLSATRVVLFASWNGATTVARWEVLAGPSTKLTKIATARDGGFETRIEVTSKADTFAVRALASSGRALAASPHVTVP